MAELIIRALSEDDEASVDKLDEKSGNYVAQWLDDNVDYAWGAFLKENNIETLIGYCTTGYADDCCKAIENHELHGLDSILLSDVYIMPEYRHCGHGSKMVEQAIKLRHLSDGKAESVFLTVIMDELKPLYEKLGFVSIDDNGNMILACDKQLPEEYKTAMAKIESALCNKESQYIIVKELKENAFLYVEVSSGTDAFDFYFHVGVSKETAKNSFIDIIQPSVLEVSDVDKIPEKLTSFENYFLKN